MQWRETELLLEGPERDDYLIYGFERAGNHVVPPHYQPKSFGGDTLLWLLPREEAGTAYCVHTGPYRVRRRRSRVTIEFEAGYTVSEYPARPACDFFGHRVKFDCGHGEQFERAYAHFYWDNLLMQCAERTFQRRKKDIREGYVLSTLDTKAYAGTYPAVDHEFHMKGRLAVGGPAEAALLRRMLELQMKIMREDKTGLSRNVCSVQPNRKREYDIWRRSEDRQCRAQMFRITANVEFVEGLYHYYCMTKDLEFLSANIAAVEHNCSYIERFIGEDALLDSHVYYEDQVIKDGKVTQAQCFAVNSLRLMEKLELLLGREEQARHYAAVARRLGDAVGKAYPDGFWDAQNGRFIDWIDARGEKHDHIHLLANQLPVLFGLADADQARQCTKALEDHRAVFSKFPSFVAAKIEEYTPSEIGVGGPYDLCAAGRYWCWDAEYKAFCRQGAALESQLVQVAQQARLDGYLMGERYDMNYVYYNTGKDGARNWHGASLYYEYPNVFLYVLICKYFGVARGFDCDLSVAPLVAGPAHVVLENYGISYTVDSKEFVLKNIGARPLEIMLPLLEKRISLAPDETFVQTAK
ncbi:MAG: hypothetical protein LIO46_07960 [Clostridiales bacterium]|nr:hypothetical protein [Clostridiales bacterium]